MRDLVDIVDIDRAHLMKRFCCVLLATTVLAACSPAAEPPPPVPPSPPAPPQAPASALTAIGSDEDPVLGVWIRKHVREYEGPLYYTAKAWGSGGDAMTLVFISGRYACGMGGCTLLILKREGEGYAELGSLGVTRLPVRVLESRTNGRPDISVHISGGGMEPAEMLIPFDGGRYAHNPTVPPARKVENPPGETVLANEDHAVTLRPE